MAIRIGIFFTPIFLLIGGNVYGQSVTVQRGLLFKNSTNIRLGSIIISNKHTLIRSRSNTVGVFSICASPGDTLEFSGDDYQTKYFITADLSDQVIYMEPVIKVPEVTVRENSISNEFAEVRRGYRSKSVFYTGTPHYYYLVLKPMTFIYENFKSEVKDARKFNRYAKRELEFIEVTSRFNDAVIKKAVDIKDEQLERFKTMYAPSAARLCLWSDYELINYIKSAYDQFKRNIKTVPVLN